MAAKKTTTTTAKKTARKKKTERSFSVVVFDVKVEGATDEVTVADLMRQVFAETPALRLQGETDSRARYQAGSFEKSGKNIWTGRIDLLRDSQRSVVHQDPSKGYVFGDDGGGEQVTTAEASALFAYHEAAGVLVFRERAAIPYTRLRTFVRSAQRSSASPYRDMGVELMILPRLRRRNVRKWFDTLDSVRQVSVKYRHSQSPGERNADRLLEQFNASEIKETVTARSGAQLSKEAVLDKRNELGLAISHIEKSAKNGIAWISGRLGEMLVNVTTRRSPERRKVTAGVTRRDVLFALSELVLSVVAAGDDDDDDDVADNDENENDYGEDAD
ncbi:MAG: hypothetical protein KF764_10585 [Labilithrix sp.]|nr:hypothetical protein [Labilithrix sp.]MBX3222396.1 hypothetical protein [Labilithrix sp.]